MKEEEWEKEEKKLKKRNKIATLIGAFFLLIILLGMYYIITSPFWTKGYLIADFGKTTKLSQTDYNTIIKIMNKGNDIEITKIAYERPFRHEASYCIFYKTKNSNEEFIFQDIIMNTNTDENYLKVKRICDKYYKRWENPWKQIDINYNKIVN